MEGLQSHWEAVMAALAAVPRPTSGLDAVHDIWLNVHAASHIPGRKGGQSLVLQYSTDSGGEGTVKVTVAKYARLLDQSAVFAYMNAKERPPFRVKFTYIASDEEGARGRWGMDLDIKKP